MFKSIINYILTNVFKIKTESTTKEIENNQKYASEYERIDDINFTSIISNKLANYVMSDSTLNIEGDNARSELLNKLGQSMWKKGKKITSMSLGYGGVILVPYAKGGKLYYNIVPQNRLTIDKTDGDLITGATVLAEKKVIGSTINSTTYYRWTNYNIENGNLTILQQFSDEKGNKIPAPEFWKNIAESITITGVDRVAFGYIPSPINNRNANDKYGVPITYGCDATINEIKECLKQIAREYELKQAFVGADVSMFNGKNALPQNGLFKKIDTGDDSFFEEFSPAIRDSSYYARLQELYQRLEKEIGTSAGILSEMKTQNATATEIKKAMYDTFTICDDMRSNIEKGLDDFFYSCNVIANAYNLSPQGEYSLSFDWSYALLEDTETEWNQLIYGVNNNIISKPELRNWLKPDETMEESQKAVEELEAKNPSVKDLIGE